jgi:prepilin-type N-terminal cleavage/methylation domain-containing protein
MKPRAFTLVEILVVLGLVAMLVVPLGLVVESGYRHFVALSRTADAKTDCAQAAERIRGWLAKHPDYRLDPDNHGLSAPGGSSLRWSQDRLELKGQSLLRWPVRDFSVIPSKRGLTLNLGVDVRVDSRRPLVRMHEIYDFPRSDS